MKNLGLSGYDNGIFGSKKRYEQSKSDLCSGQDSTGHLCVLPFWPGESEMERRWKVPSRLDEGKSVIVFRAVCSRQDSNRAWWSHCSGVCQAESKVTWGLRANFWRWALAGWVFKKKKASVWHAITMLVCAEVYRCNRKRVHARRYGNLYLWPLYLIADLFQ